jgi:NAD dependent epimerase/dehydratase family enzyme
VVPTRLLREGFQFAHPGITEALLDLLGERSAAQWVSATR